MALTFDPKSKLFQADYQAPFGGIDSTAYATAINPANFANLDSVYIEDNVIKPVLLQTLGTLTGVTMTGHYLGFIPIQSPTLSTRLGCTITDTNVYNLDYVAGTGLIVSAAHGYTPAKTADNSYFHYIVIDSIQSGAPTIYWTAGGWNEIWTQDPISGNVTLLTNYVGGGILGLLNNQLLNLGGFSQLDGAVPNRISWSAPGQYGVFLPYDIPSGTGSYAAGFNDLPSISDIITGFAAIGTVGYLFRTEGITQLNVTGNSLPPFLFNHLWASELGIGCPYPYTITQYGSIVAFATDAGIYSLGLNGLSEIGGQARTYLYQLLNSQFITNPAGNYTLGPQGRIVPYILTSPETFYLLSIPLFVGGVSTFRYILINLGSGALFNLGDYPVSARTNTQLAFFNTYVLTNPIQGKRIITTLVINSALGGSLANLPLFSYFKTDFNKVAVLTFRKEQLKLLYQPTVSKVILLGALIDTTQQGKVNVSVDGGLTFNTAFPDISVINGVGDPGHGIIGDLISDGVQTLERPQLVLKLTNVQIVEAWYQGTLADYEVI